MSVWKTLLVVVLGLFIVRGDLPVHCLKHQIVGKWKLDLGQVELTGLGPLSCGHDIPDSSSNSYLAGQKHFQAKSHLNIILGQNNNVYLQEDKSKVTGRWTMVYDEGFELKHETTRFFAFSKYAPDPSIGWQSYCGQTLVGWYHNTENDERGCYRATKSDNQGQPTEQAQNGHVVQPKLVEIDDSLDKEELVMTQEIQEQMVKSLNEKHITWTAKAYEKWNGLTYIQVNRRAGVRRYYQRQDELLIEEHEQLDDKLEEQTDSENDPYRNFSLNDISDLPTAFSWEKYLGPVREQKDCGSCYAISTMGMLSARLKINGHNVDLAPQQSIDCNYYNQGCDGGYPFLVEKFGSEQLLVTESHYPYTGYTETCKKDVSKNLKTTYGVKNYKFIGGVYGKTNERKIMDEIYNNGPVVMNFEPQFDIMFYGGGIYHSTQAADWILEHKKKPEWEKVDHSVLCYGWGIEDGEKYWLLQNSWGSSWGENGFFRMRRGTDESAIESMAESAEPIVHHKTESFLQNQKLIKNVV